MHYSNSAPLSHEAGGNYLNVRGSAAGELRLIFNSRGGEIAPDPADQRCRRREAIIYVASEVTDSVVADLGTDASGILTTEFKFFSNKDFLQH